jgi:hypothetical protein
MAKALKNPLTEPLPKELPVADVEPGKEFKAKPEFVTA